MKTITDFLDHFGSAIEDPREAMKTRHPVDELLLVTLCGVIGGADSWEGIETFGESKLDILQEILPFTHGAPSDDTLRRFYRAIDPNAFQTAFVAFVQTLLPEAGKQLIVLWTAKRCAAAMTAQPRRCIWSALSPRKPGWCWRK
jgi:hypothetical protein